MQVVIGENKAILLVLCCSHEVALAFLTVEHGHNGRSGFPTENCSLRNHLRLLVGAKMTDQTDVQRRILRERNASVGFVMVLVGQPHDALAAENKTAVFSVFGIEHCFRENTLAALNAADRGSLFDCIVINSKYFSGIRHKYRSFAERGIYHYRKKEKSSQGDSD